MFELMSNDKKRQQKKKKEIKIGAIQIQSKKNNNKYIKMRKKHFIE